jgi:TPP-dependent indolepyruvate ferredoxin oxidoreductase alpha subunit
MYTNELPEEMMKKIEDAFTDIDKYSKVIKEATSRKRQATADVKSTIETIDLKQGESLESRRVGLYARVVQGKQSRLNRDALAQLGVSEAILDLGTITKDSRPYVKIVHVPTAKQEGGNENGFTNGFTRPNPWGRINQ